MKKIIYFSSILICSLILIGLSFVLPAKAALDIDLLNPDELINNPSNDNTAITATPSPDATTPSTANASIEVATNSNNGKLYVFIKFYNYTVGNTISYTISLINEKGEEITTDFTDINLTIDNNEVSQIRDISNSVVASGNYIIYVSTYDSLNSANILQNSVNANLTKNSSGQISLNESSGGAPNNTINPNTPATPGGSSTPTPTQGSGNTQDIFLGSLSTSKISNALTGGKTLVETINPNKNTDEKFWVFQVWRFCMSLINSVMVAFLIFLAFVNILRIQMDTYAIKKILPTLVLAVILANFSLLICRAVVDFSDVLVHTFADNKEQLAKDLVSALGLSDRAANLLQMPVVSNFASGGVASLLVLLAGIILAFIPAIAILILAFLLWIRVIVVQVLVAISPLAFIAMVLPITKTWFARWWGQLFNWTYMAVAIFFLLKVISLMKPSGTGVQIWTLVAAWVVLYLTVQVPFKLGGALMSAWSNAGKFAASKLGRGFGMAYGSGMVELSKLDNEKRNPFVRAIGKFAKNTNLYGVKEAIGERLALAEKKRMDTFRGGGMYQAIAGYEAAARFHTKDIADAVSAIQNQDAAIKLLKNTGFTGYDKFLNHYDSINDPVKQDEFLRKFVYGSPTLFAPLAEECGLAPAQGAWVRLLLKQLDYLERYNYGRRPRPGLGSLLPTLPMGLAGANKVGNQPAQQLSPSQTGSLANLATLPATQLAQSQNMNQLKQHITIFAQSVSGKNVENLDSMDLGAAQNFQTILENTRSNPALQAEVQTILEVTPILKTTINTNDLFKNLPDELRKSITSLATGSIGPVNITGLHPEALIKIPHLSNEIPKMFGPFLGSNGQLRPEIITAMDQETDKARVQLQNTFKKISLPDFNFKNLPQGHIDIGQYRKSAVEGIEKLINQAGNDREKINKLSENRDQLNKDLDQLHFSQQAQINAKNIENAFGGTYADINNRIGGIK